MCWARGESRRGWGEEESLEDERRRANVGRRGRVGMMKDEEWERKRERRRRKIIVATDEEIILENRKRNEGNESVRVGCCVLLVVIEYEDKVVRGCSGVNDDVAREYSFVVAAFRSEEFVFGEVVRTRRLERFVVCSCFGVREGRFLERIVGRTKT